jgi:HAD superfamily hydrolase (TIGR01509 family)
MTEQNAIANYLKFSGNKSVDIKVALIDMDGVLYDSMKNHTRAWFKLMSKNGIKCTRDEFYLYEGMTGTDIIKKKFKEGRGINVTDDEAKAYYKVKSRYFQELGEPGKIKGADEMLNALKDAGIERILVTGSGQESVLEKIDKDYQGLFSETRITAADTKYGKPNPEPYMKAMAKAGVKPNECVVIENAPLGVQAGHTAGCFTVGVTTGPIPEKDLMKSGADIVYKTMLDFAAAIPELVKGFNATKA